MLVECPCAMQRENHYRWREGNFYKHAVYVAIVFHTLIETLSAVPVRLLTNTTISSLTHLTPATEIGFHDNYGCTIHNVFYSDGVQVPSDPKKPCELCYCIRNRTVCIMQECTLHVEGCKPVYQDGVCCPVRYNCDYEKEDAITSRLQTIGEFIKSTTHTSTIVDCQYGHEIYSDGELIITNKPCERCYCMTGYIVCAVQDCEPPKEKDCPPTDKCCPPSSATTNKTLKPEQLTNTTAVISSTEYPPRKSPSEINKLTATSAKQTETRTKATETSAKATETTTKANQIRNASSTTLTKEQMYEKLGEKTKFTIYPTSEKTDFVTLVSQPPSSMHSSDEMQLDDNPPNDGARYPDLGTTSSSVNGEQPLTTIAYPSSSPPTKLNDPNVTSSTGDSRTTNGAEIYTTVKPAPDALDDATSSSSPIVDDLNTITTTTIRNVEPYTDTVTEGSNKIGYPHTNTYETTTTKTYQHEISDQLATTTVIYEVPTIYETTTDKLAWSDKAQETTSDAFVSEQTTAYPSSAAAAAETFSKGPSSYENSSEPDGYQSTTREFDNTSPPIQKEPQETTVAPTKFPDENPVTDNVVNETTKPPQNESEKEDQTENINTVSNKSTPPLKRNDTATSGTKLQETTTQYLVPNLETTVHYVSPAADSDSTMRPDIAAEKVGNLVPTTSASGETETVSPAGIPGEGSCLVDGLTYPNTSVIESSNPCHLKCICLSSIPTCALITCDPPPDNSNCMPVQVKPESCCPQYVCNDNNDNPSKAGKPPIHNQVEQEVPQHDDYVTTENTIKDSYFPHTEKYPQSQNTKSEASFVSHSSTTEKHRYTQKPENEPAKTTEVNELTTLKPHHTDRDSDTNYATATNRTVKTTEKTTTAETKKPPFSDPSSATESESYGQTTAEISPGLETTPTILQDEHEDYTISTTVTQSRDKYEINAVTNTVEPFHKTTTTIGSAGINDNPATETTLLYVETNVNMLPTTTTTMITTLTNKQHEIMKEGKRNATNNNLTTLLDELENIVSSTEDEIVTTTTIPEKTTFISVPAADDSSTPLNANTILQTTYESGNNYDHTDKNIEALTKLDVTNKSPPDSENNDVTTTTNPAPNDSSNAPMTSEQTFFNDDNESIKFTESSPLPQTTNYEKFVHSSQEPATTYESESMNDVAGTTPLPNIAQSSAATETTVATTIATDEQPQPEGETTISNQSHFATQTTTHETSTATASSMVGGLRKNETEEPTTTESYESAPTSTSIVSSEETTTVTSNEDDTNATTPPQPSELDAVNRLSDKYDNATNTVTPPNKSSSGDSNEIGTATIAIEHSSTLSSATDHPPHEDETTTNVSIADLINSPSSTDEILTNPKSTLPPSPFSSNNENTQTENSAATTLTASATLWPQEQPLPTTNFGNNDRLDQSQNITTTQEPEPLSTEHSAPPSLTLTPSTESEKQPTTGGNATETKLSGYSTTEKHTVAYMVIPTTTFQVPDTSSENETGSYTPIQHSTWSPKPHDEEPTSESNYSQSPMQQGGVINGGNTDPAGNEESEYDEDNSAFGPGTCRYGGKVYVSAQQIPRDDPCDFCFCFRSDIICLQQSCPPPIQGCRQEPIQGFCCPRYECPVATGTSNTTKITTTTTTTSTTTTLPPRYSSESYRGTARRTGCLIHGLFYNVGDDIAIASGPCLECICGSDGRMKCDPKSCSPEPYVRQMIEEVASHR